MTYSELDLAQIHAVRRRAWQDKYPKHAAFIARWEDGFERSATHFLALSDGQIKAVARVNHAGSANLSLQFAQSGEMVEFIGSLQSPIAVISRLSVDPDARGLGLAKTMDEVRIAFAREAGCTAIVCEVKTGAHRADALAALGFKPVEGVAAYPAYPFPSLKDAPERLCQPLWLPLD